MVELHSGSGSAALPLRLALLTLFVWELLSAPIAAADAEIINVAPFASVRGAGPDACS